MPALARQDKIRSSKIGNFNGYLLDALQDDVINRYPLIFETIFKSPNSFTKKLTENIKSMSQTLTALPKRGQEKDKKIQELEKMFQNLSQYKIRFFGLSVDTPGTTNAKMLPMPQCYQSMKPGTTNAKMLPMPQCYQSMQLVPPLSIA